MLRGRGVTAQPIGVRLGHGGFTHCVVCVTFVLVTCHIPGSHLGEMISRVGPMSMET